MSDDKKNDVQSEIKDSILKHASQIYMSDAGPNTSNNDVIGSVLSILKKHEDIRTAKKLVIDVDPKKSQNYSSVYQNKSSMIPPDVIKRIRDSEELIGGVILPTRGRQLSLFGRPRANRFDIGFSINLKPEAYIELNEQQQKELREKEFPRLRETLLNCGSNNGVRDSEKMTLAQFMMASSEDVLAHGYLASEIRVDGKNVFHSFRPVDAGTIYKTTPQKGHSQEAENIRKQSKAILERLQGKKVDIKKFQQDEYTWAQVIDDQIQQVFTDKEMIVMQMTPSTDVNRSGYPVSPLERIVSAITTHINLTTHNKMFFVNGRAARNALVFKSSDLEPQDIEAIKIQMQSHINSVNAAWRMPVFGVGPNDEVNVVPLDPSGKDMEFQYLADLNKRMIFAAYQMSPDEVAALSYLSRGTNSQSLSESNNEWKLIAARDIGLRPLLLLYEDFFNERLLPLINKNWAKYLRIDFEGLDADSPEKEATRLQQDSALFMSMNDIMEKVEKEKIPLAGKFPLNAAWMQVMEKYYTKGEILKAFDETGKYKEADKDPNYAYCMGDPTSVQMWMAKQQMQMQAQMQPQGQGQDQDGQPSQADQLTGGEDLESALTQLGQTLSKNEGQGSKITAKKVAKAHKTIKEKIMAQLEKESSEAIKKIIKVAEDEVDKK